MQRAAPQVALSQQKPTGRGRVRPVVPTELQVNEWGDRHGYYSESMAHMAERICLYDDSTQDAIGERARADFYSDPVRYPCTLPPRDQAAAYYNRIQHILDKETEITTLYEYVHVLVLPETSD
jgi:hypothetical protein